MLSQRQTLICGAFMGGLAVALGAFGAHAFKPILLANNRLDTYELAVRYHFFHALALLAIGLLIDRLQHKARVSALLIVVGTILFSGSLYVMALGNTNSVAIVTPIGGVLMLAGWAMLVYSLIKTTHRFNDEK